MTYQVFQQIKPITITPKSRQALWPQSRLTHSRTNMASLVKLNLIILIRRIGQLPKTSLQSSNLNFNVSNQSAGDVITDLLTDTYNLDGSDTGHRAWLLSSRLTTTGIGAAYGENNYRYSVQQVAYPSDGYKAAAKVQLLIQIAAFFNRITSGK